MALQSACYRLNLGEVFLIVKASRRCWSESLFRNTVSADVLVFDRSQRYFHTFSLWEYDELFSPFVYAAAQIMINGRIGHSLFDLLKCKAKVNTMYTRPYLFSALCDMFRKNMINHKACKKVANQKWIHRFRGSMRDIRTSFWEPFRRRAISGI